MQNDCLRIAVQFIGYVTPWALFGSMLTTVGAGLITTFTPSSTAGEWIGYQILIGTGRGSVLQMVRSIPGSRQYAVWSG